MSTPTAEDVHGWLTAIPDLMAHLPDAMVTRTHQQGGGRPVPASKPPVKLEIVHLLDRRTKHDWEQGMGWCDPDRQGVLPYLDGWCRDIEATAYESRPELPPEVPADPTVTTACAWLLGMLDYAETLPQWPEFADGIRVTHRNLLAATAVVRDRERPVRCQRCGVGTLTRPGEEALWECAACGSQVKVQAVTLRQAAGIIGMSARTLQDWARRPGVLSPILADTGSRKLFDLGDIRRLVAEQRVRRAIE